MPNPNLTPETAVEITPLPFTYTETPDSTAGVWFKYTGTANPNELGIFVFSSGSIRTAVFSPTSSAAYPSGDPISGVINLAFQIPVTNGATHYVKVYNDTTEFTLDARAGPNTTAPSGSIFVPDDRFTLPGVVISSVDGTPLRFIHPFPHGEHADVIASGTYQGRILTEDFSNGHVKLYSPSYTLLSDLLYENNSEHLPIRSNKTTRFYAGNPADATNSFNATVKTVEMTAGGGVFGATTWTLPSAGLVAIAPNVAETILYHAGQDGSVNKPIKRWDLVNNVALSDLAASLGAGFEVHLGCILVLNDDTIIVAYSNGAYSNPAVIKRYNSSGTVLNTYATTGSASAFLRIAYALDDPNSFWTWNKPGGGMSRFTNVKVSDGSVLSTFDAVMFEDGIYEPTVTATPLARFGHSHSCPFLLTRTAEAAAATGACPCGLSLLGAGGA